VSFRPEPFSCEVKRGRASAVVEITGELDLATVAVVQDALQSVIASRAGGTARRIHAPFSVPQAPQTQAQSQPAAES
jgi:hypothetical protein